MGVVYLARDTRLDRDVAIKSLPEHLAADPDRLARFEREAKVLATLNHPNVAGIYGVEEQDNARYLILEYVEGETLAERLDRGPLAIEDVIEIAAQVAAGIEAAHEAGVIHRDLKPANIKFDDEGKARVLDFGLARADENSTAGSSVSQLPTLTSPAMGSPTQAGVILGTAAYMSPEQARGRKVDKRTDIWSFGVVLYEMLVGASPFLGETVSDSIGAILHKDINLSTLRPEVPASVRRILQRCVERDKNRRYRDIGDVRIELVTPDDTPLPVEARASSRAPWLVAAVAVLAGAAGLILSFSSTPSWNSEQMLEVDVRPPDSASWINGTNIGWGIISPDGSMIVGRAASPEGAGLWIKPLDGSESRLIAETESAYYPFWSPDSREIAYWNNGGLYKIGVDAGRPRRLCDSVDLRGGDWHKNGTIIFTPLANGDIYIVSDQGGDPVQITKNDPARGENAHYWPQWLPDGKRFIYFIRSSNRDNQGIFFGKVPDDGSLDDGRRLVQPADTNGHYVPASKESPAAILWAQDGELLARAFDEVTESVFGPTSVIDDDVSTMQAQLASLVSVSDTGALLWARTGYNQQLLSWLGRSSGEPIPVDAPTGSVGTPRVSPDGSQIAFAMTSGGFSDIWVYDIESNQSRPALVSPLFEGFQYWSPDSTELIAFQDFTSVNKFVRFRADGVGTPMLPFRDAEWAQGLYGGPLDWLSEDWLVYSGIGLNNEVGLFSVNLNNHEKTPVLLVETEHRDGSAHSSPNDDAIIFTRGRPGGFDYYLASLSITDEGPVIANDSQLVPIDSAFKAYWSTTGDEFFVSTRTGDIWSVPVEWSDEPGARVRMGRAVKLRNIPALTKDGEFAYDAANERFMVSAVPNGESQTLTLLTNWRQRMRTEP
jgi:serine/threonine protein kinase